MSTHYRLYCTTENKYIDKWASTALTTCPTNSLHIVQDDSLVILEQKFNEMTISKDGLSDFTSITEALAANAGKSNTVLRIFPGTYIEYNPLSIPPGCSLLSVGTPGNVIVMGNDPTKDMFIIYPWAKIYGILINGYGASGCRAVYYNGSLGGGAMADIQDCIISNFDIGIEVEYGPDTLLIRSCIITASTSTLSKGIYCHNGGLIIANNLMITGSSTNKITQGMHIADALTKVSLTSVAIYLCTHGLYGENGAAYEISLITLRYCTNAVTIGTVLPACICRLSALNIQDSLVYDLNILATTSDINIFSGQLDEAKVYNPNNVNINARYQYVAQNKVVCSITGSIKYGTPEQPTNLSIGEGQYDNLGNKMFSNSNLELGTWVNNTSAALENDNNSFFLFQGTTTDNCCYIGSKRPILGTKIYITTAATSPVENSDIMWEYWNGTSWVLFNVMQCYSSKPNYTYINYNCLTIASKFHVRFGLTTDTPFATKTLNGETLNWVRMRIVNAIASIPVCEYFKLHCSHTEISGDGYIEHFGNARTVSQFSWKQESGSSANSNITDKEIYVASNISVAKRKNKFASGELCRIGMSGYLPSDCDVSFPIKIKMSFIGDSNTGGNVMWKARLTHTRDDSNVYSNIADAPTDATFLTTMTNITTISSNKANREQRQIIEMNINNLYISPKPEDGNESLLWLSIERDSQVSNTNDTYTGSVYLVDYTCHYIRWCNNNHILSF